MNTYTDHLRQTKSKPQPGSRPARKQHRWLALAGGLLIAASLSAATLPVPNGSFESPTPPPGFPATPLLDDWQKTPQPAWFDPSTSGITWDQLTGAFPNPPPGSDQHIPNMDGEQAAYLFAMPEVGIFQELEATYQVGFSYELTVGLMGAGGITEGSTLALGFYYQGPGDARVPVATAEVTYSAAGFPNPRWLYDTSVQVPMVGAAAPWAGQPIGLQLLSTGGTGTGYWDADHVRLTVVPEPGSGSLLLLGLGGWLLARRRAVPRATVSSEPAA